MIDRFRVRKWDKAVFHKEEIGEFKIDFGFLAINQFPVQFFRKKNPFSTKEKSERSKFVGFLAFDRFRVQYFRERKWKKGIFQEEESKLVGSNDRSISRAIQNFRRKWKEGIFQESDFARHRFPRWEPLAGTGVVSLGASIPRGVGLLHDPADRPRTSNGSVI